VDLQMLRCLIREFYVPDEAVASALPGRAS